MATILKKKWSDEMTGKKKVSDEEILTLGELFKQADTELPVFVGTLVNAGKQQAYEEQVMKMRKDEPRDPLMSLSEFLKAKEEFLNKVIE